MSKLTKSEAKLHTIVDNNSLDLGVWIKDMKPVELTVYPGEELDNMSSSRKILVNPDQVVIVAAHTKADKTCYLITAATVSCASEIVVMGSRDEVARKLWG